MDFLWIPPLCSRHLHAAPVLMKYASVRQPSCFDRVYPNFQLTPLSSKRCLSRQPRRLPLPECRLATKFSGSLRIARQIPDPPAHCLRPHHRSQFEA